MIEKSVAAVPPASAGAKKKAFMPSALRRSVRGIRPMSPGDVHERAREHAGLADEDRARTVGGEFAVARERHREQEGDHVDHDREHHRGQFQQDDVLTRRGRRPPPPNIVPKSAMRPTRPASMPTPEAIVMMATSRCAT